MENFQGGRELVLSYVESQFSIVLYPTYDTIFTFRKFYNLLRQKFVELKSKF